MKLRITNWPNKTFERGDEIIPPDELAARWIRLGYAEAVVEPSADEPDAA